MRWDVTMAETIMHRSNRCDFRPSEEVLDWKTRHVIRFPLPLTMECDELWVFFVYARNFVVFYGDGQLVQTLLRIGTTARKRGTPRFLNLMGVWVSPETGGPPIAL